MCCIVDICLCCAAVKSVHHSMCSRLYLCLWPMLVPTGWPASSGPFAFRAPPSFPCALGIGDFLFPGMVVWRRRGGSKTIMIIFNFGPLLMTKMHPYLNECDTTAGFSTWTQTHVHAEDAKSMHHSIICLKSKVSTRRVRSAHPEDGRPRHAHEEDHRGFFLVAQRWQTASCR